MRLRHIGLAGIAAAGLLVAACGSSGSTTPATGGASSSASSPSSATGSASGSGSAQVKTTMIKGATVLTNASGLTLYWFVPDTATKSVCNGSCATYWPPVKGPVSAGSGVTGTLGTITRDDGSIQATWNGHPLYTYAGDTAPGMAKGDNLNASGGVWHEVSLSGSAAPATSPSSSKSGGYGY
jgi:predicted lipoprotein with Yx(FWY)xxD motif